MHPSKLVFVVLSALALGAGVGCTVSSQQEESAESDITGTDRVALMDALRSTVKPSLANQDIVFDVSKGSLRDANGWAAGFGVIKGSNKSFFPSVSIMMVDCP